MTDNRH